MKGDSYKSNMEKDETVIEEAKGSNNLKPEPANKRRKSLMHSIVKRSQD